MSQYITKGNRIEVIADGAVNLQSILPAYTYFIKYDQSSNSRNFYLEKSDNFQNPKRIFGNLEERTNRVINTYLDRKDHNVNTGVLLSGIKGSGKTIQAKIISNKLRIEHNIPTLIVLDTFDSVMLSLFLKDITDPAVILFEEFEKMYKSLGSSDKYRGNDLRIDNDPNIRIGSRDLQEGLLTLLDGVMNSNKLFIFTCNNANYVHDLLLNRPGRVWYHFKYLGLEEDVIEDYCNKKLKNKSHIEQMKRISDFLDEGFTFDVMQSIIEEANRYDIEPFKAVQDLNIEPQPFSNLYTYTIKSDNEDINVINDRFEQEIFIENYLSNKPVFISFRVQVRNDKEIKAARDLKVALKSSFNNFDFSTKTNIGLSENKELVEMDEYITDEGMGFSKKPSDRLKFYHMEIALGKNDLTFSSKKTLIYKKFGLIITLNKQQKNNFWNSMFA